MSLTSSKPQNIQSIIGNGLAIYLDAQNNVMLKDIRGKTAPITQYLPEATGGAFAYNEDVSEGNAILPSGDRAISNNNSNTVRDSSVLGGISNAISSSYALSRGFVIVGGYSNVIRGNAFTGYGFSAIVSGSQNRICNGSSFIGSGIENIIGENVGSSAFIGAGDENSILGQGDNHVIVGGTSNRIASLNLGSKHFVGSGFDNIIASNGLGYGSVVNGLGNRITGDFGFLATGSYNCITGQNGFIGNGYANCVGAGYHGTVVSGEYNCVVASRGFIGSGNTNQVLANESVIVGGGSNTHYSGSVNSFIGGGSNNCTFDTGEEGGGFNFIGGGFGNNACGCFSFVGNACNSTANAPLGATVVNGNANNAIGASAFIGTGELNQACTCAFVGTGAFNIASGQNSVIISGTSNTTITFNGFVGTGNLNFVCQSNSAIVTGANNLICGANAFITTGSNNIIDAPATFGFINGELNTVTGYAGFVHGQNSCATASHAVVFGDTLVNSCANSLLTCQLRASILCGGAINVCVDANGTLIRDVSDKRYKKSIKPIASALDKANALNPVSFYWNKKGESMFGNRKQIGFIAQEVYKVIPEAVVVSPDGEYGLSKDKLTAISIASIKELTKHVCNICKHLNQK